MYTNARSMGNKQEELEALLGIGGCDLVGTTETWWDERQIWNVNIEGYHLFRKDRKGKRGGGMALYVREGIGCSEIECSTDGDLVETVWVKLRGFDRERDLIVGVCYRPPGQLETLDDVLTGQILRISRRRDTVIMGDFSLPDITWETHSAVTARSRHFLEAIEGAFFTQRVREATRGGNILDLVLTNREELIDEVQIRGALDASDHSILCFEIRGLRTGSRLNTRSWDFKRANFGQLKARLGKVSWDRLLEGPSNHHSQSTLRPPLPPPHNHTLSHHHSSANSLNRNSLTNRRNQIHAPAPAPNDLATTPESVQLQDSWVLNSNVPLETR
ncbi:Teneurin-2 [Varanus komodoensis]|nr:Teneurin-2 [Varanus komodoensis]